MVGWQRLTKGVQQLLAIWNKAKGKERDALLWGDEVGIYTLGV
jgi:glutamate--cysteine ligase catalytic subunit